VITTSEVVLFHDNKCDIYTNDGASLDGEILNRDISNGILMVSYIKWLKLDLTC